MKMGEEEISTGNYKEFLISGSRDRTLIIWELNNFTEEGDQD